MPGTLPAVLHLASLFSFVCASFVVAGFRRDVSRSIAISTELRAISWGLLAVSFFLTGWVSIDELSNEDTFYLPPLRFYLGAFGLPAFWWGWCGLLIADRVHRLSGRSLVLGIATNLAAFLAYTAVGAMTVGRG